MKTYISNFFTFMAAVLSENGFPSSARFLMMLFSLATIRIMFIIIYHLTHVNDVGTLGMWLGNLPIIIAALIGLISTPYAINKGTTSIASIAGLITSARENKPTETTTTPVSQTNITVKN